MSIEIKPSEKNAPFFIWIAGLIIITIIVYALAFREIGVFGEAAKAAKAILSPEMTGGFVGLLLIILVLAIVGWTFWRKKPEKIEWVR
jgi:uncharacterized membrane protein